jgi:hypothetical protein
MLLFLLNLVIDVSVEIQESVKFSDTFPISLVGSVLVTLQADRETHHQRRGA